MNWKLRNCDQINLKCFSVGMLCFIGFMLFSVLPLKAINDRDSLLNLPLFKSDSLLKLELKTNLNILIEDVGEKRSYHECYLREINNIQTNNNWLRVQIKARGNFRRRKQNCDFPPLRFKIPTKRAGSSIFKGQDKIKYVSHCKNSIDAYEQHTIEEYLLYKMYNLISDHSYRVRLSQILFIDTITNDTLQKFGFFLENRNDVASRNGKKMMHYKNMKQYNLLRDNMVMLSLFQLMIGNTDWDIGRLHNIDLMSVSEQSIPIAVPYDFDWSGIIDQEYYTQDQKIDPNAKYQRLYKGYRWGSEDLHAAFSEFQELKESFLGIIFNCPYLNSENKKRVGAYIEEFYQLITSRKDVKAVIVKKSPKIPSAK
ncbi:hypothetical protein [Ancylomarina longa]|uniref:Uncharacterized protein n=1 Tax=Ancylomarina longa TaxID=2487017 RepID=A0A434AF19_9BACT|nr:hypothetical protein [Ancylomarina longa]RUT72973.1 hypothetical protein DLK05_15715 [Ancylomarina longa]